MGDFAERRGGYEPENYHIGPDDRLGHGGAKTKFADNIAAIRLLKDLQERKIEVAGPEDKKIIKMLLNEMSEREIAAEVGLSQKGVNKHKHKIKDFLRARLEKYI